MAVGDTGATESREHERSPARFERRKEAIVRAAVEPLNRAGVRGMTLAEVAGQLQVVPTAISYYFKRKEDLAAACFLNAIARYDALLDEAGKQPTSEAALRRFLEDFAAEVRDIRQKAAEPIASFDDVRTIHDKEVDQAFIEMFRRVRRLFNESATGPLARQERNARTHLLLSQCFWAISWLGGYDPADYSRMVDRMLDVLLNGLIAPGAQWSPKLLPSPERSIGAEGISREAFLRAATELINEEGYLGASVAKISARLKVTKGSFYHHNQAKDDVVTQCFDRTLAIMRETQESADRETRTGFDNVVALAASLVQWQVSGETPLLRTSALAAVPEELRLKVIGRFEEVSARVASVISDGIADGSIRPIDASVAAHMLTATINAGAELHHWAPDLDAAGSVQAYLQPLFLGLFTGRQA